MVSSFLPLRYLRQREYPEPPPTAVRLALVSDSRRHDPDRLVDLRSTRPCGRRVRAFIPSTGLTWWWAGVWSSGSPVSWFGP